MKGLQNSSQSKNGLNKIWLMAFCARHERATAQEVCRNTWLGLTILQVSRPGQKADRLLRWPLQCPFDSCSGRETPRWRAQRPQREMSDIAQGAAGFCELAAAAAVLHCADFVLRICVCLGNCIRAISAGETKSNRDHSPLGQIHVPVFVLALASQELVSQRADVGPSHGRFGGRTAEVSDASVSWRCAAHD